MQSLMLHNILVRKKSILDQFRRGLSIVGLLDEIERSPQLFEDCFVHKDEVSYQSVADCLNLAASEDEGAERVFQMLHTFIRNSSPDDLDDLLTFVTGSRSSATCILPRRITVSCATTNSIFASTCLLDLKLPKHFDSYKDFESAMRSVIKGNTFMTG